MLAAEGYFNEGPQLANRLDSVMKQLLDAVKELQSMGVAHRDLKPANILMIRREDADDVNDFGIKVGPTICLFLTVEATGYMRGHLVISHSIPGRQVTQIHTRPLSLFDSNSQGALFDLVLVHGALSADDRLRLRDGPL
jgi:serine/threonine protein kinase